MKSELVSQYLSLTVQHELFDILDEVFFFLVNNYDSEILKITEEAISRMTVSEESTDEVFPQLVWWGTFCSPIGPEETTIYQRYLQTNKHKWERKSVEVQRVLVSWLGLNPGFYYIESKRAENDTLFVLVDVFEGKTKLVCIYNEIFQSLKKGEMLTGLLMPLGNGYYTTLGGLFHIPGHKTQKVAREILPYFERHAVSPNYKFNASLYPSMINLTLEAMKENN